MVTPKARCEATGGRWDEATKRCIGGKTSPEREKELFGGVGVEPTPPKPTKIIYNEQGKPTGVEQPSGRTLLGLKKEDVTKLTQPSGITGAGAIPGVSGGVIGAQEFAAQEQEQRRMEAIDTERQRISAEELPIRVELDPETSFLERTPVAGGVFGAIKDTIQEIVLTTVPEGEYKEEFKKYLGVAQPREIRDMALQQIQKQEIERGLTASEKFGRFLEGVGLSNFSLFGFSAKDLVETPSENAMQVKKNIIKERKRIANIETNVKLGYLPVGDAQIQLDDIETNIIKLEGRLIMLVNNSPELKYNSDLLNTWETEIIGVKEKVFQGKQNILTGKTEDPTEWQMYEQLRLTPQEDEEE